MCQRKWQVFFGVCSVVLALFLPWDVWQSSGSYVICSQRGRNIYTVDKYNTRTEFLAIEGSHIVDVGPLAKFQASRKIRLIPPEAIVVPGISDSHAHILEYGAVRQLSLEGAKSSRDAVARVRQYILDTPDICNDTSKVITGGGWDHTSPVCPPL